MSKWRVYFLESEKGWRQERWHNDYDFEEAAMEVYNDNQPVEGPAPDYYIIATDIKEITC